MRTIHLPPLLVLLSGCPTTSKPVETGSSETEMCTFHADSDGDGWGDALSDTVAPCAEPPLGVVDDATDCDDTLASVHPQAPELCDGLDNDCDAQVDEEVLDTWYADSDGDGFGVEGSTATGCERPEGYAPVAGDCDDADPQVFSGAGERCDEKDNDCDGLVDEDLVQTWYADGDGDGYGDATASLTSCDPGPGWVADSTDCNDSRSTAWPGAPELCDERDNDCDGLVDEDLLTPWYPDLDGDGWGDGDTATLLCEPGAGWTGTVGDCDDHNSDIHPDATEVCDHLDNDCDGLLDDADPDVTGGSTWYGDADGDGWGTDASLVTACDAPAATSGLPGDCDDADARYHPGADESDCADPADYNCDGSVGYSDVDGDGWAACQECDDADASVRPGAEETCDGRDQDCDGAVDEDAVDAPTWYADADGDGWGHALSPTLSCTAPDSTTADATDCDDSLPHVHPGAPETCDGLDEDCDGAADEGVGTSWYADADGDGFGDPLTSTTACDVPEGFTADDTDCDDLSSSTFPGAVEVCDGLDNDCDGAVDEAGSTDAPTWYADADGDGYGDPLASTEACAPDAGWVPSSTDCDDTLAGVYPGAPEVCDGLDQDCDGAVDEDAADAPTWYTDEDGDGFGDPSSPLAACDPPEGATSDPSDCDDTSPDVYPGAPEVCDGLDQDCDSVLDDGVLSLFYADTDGDGYGDPDTSTLACTAPDGWVPDSSDCDDALASVSPDALEVCDGLDDDCDGAVDEADAWGAPTWYTDADDDGFGDPASPVAACAAPDGTVADSTDCQDADDTIWPGARELCDDLDNDCDGVVDEGDAGDAVTWYLDGDGDGFGDASSVVLSCARPTGYVADSTDCDDTTSSIHPGAPEVCDGMDQDCDSVSDDGALLTFYADTDGDGYGDADTSTLGCTAPEGWVTDATDCDDTAATVSPGSPETCDGRDDDCDGTVDEPDAVDAPTWYDDRDEDGFGDPALSTVQCDRPAGWVGAGTDCDDMDHSVFPGATEVCDSKDDDCDGSVDEGVTLTFYRDADGDGYGLASSTTRACTPPSGWVTTSTDCDDSQASVHPGAAEVCDDLDQDCDGVIDDRATDAPTWYIDYDGDSYGSTAYSYASCDAPTGYVADTTDCDDRDEDTHPDADEVCDGEDDDCDGDVDEPDAVDAPTWYLDGDCDGYGDPASATPSCEAESGWISDGTDCDDEDALSRPGLQEIIDGADNDCDGSTDEGALDPFLIADPTFDAIEAPDSPGACGTIGEVVATYDPHTLTNIDSYMRMLDGTLSGLYSSVDVSADALDWSDRCGTDSDASIGNYTASTNPWPSVPTAGTYGAARFRGYLNLKCGDPLQYTFGLIGNDSLTLTIGGTYVMGVNWSDGRWKKFRYVAFPGPGLYPFEVEWSTNLVCEIDPFELVWAEGFVSGYDDYDTMCSYSTCTYGNGVPIPGFSVVEGDSLLSATDGGPTSCGQCVSALDCGTGEVCNSAGLCQ